MISSVRECICARQAGYLADGYRLSALARASGALGRALTSQDVFVLLLLVMFMMAGLVVFPAIWSGKPARRKAALAVLDRLMRWRW